MVAAPSLALSLIEGFEIHLCSSNFTVSAEKLFFNMFQIAFPAILGA